MIVKPSGKSKDRPEKNQELFLIDKKYQGNQYEVIPVTVCRVGIEFFYVYSKSGVFEGTRAFYLCDWREKWREDCVVSETPQYEWGATEQEEDVEWGKLARDLRRTFLSSEASPTISLSLKALRQITAIIKEENPDE